MKGSQECMERILCMGRFYLMYKSAMGFMRGIGTGLIAGMAIAAMGSKMMNGNKRFRRRSNKTMRAVGELMDDVQNMFR